MCNTILVEVLKNLHPINGYEIKIPNNNNSRSSKQ